MPASLERLLRPASIAVFGGREAARVVEQCDRMGYAGAIWPVHPARDEIRGRRCYRSIADLPAPPDAAFVGVNRMLTIDIVRDLAARGGGGAVCYASGFREATGLTDASALQDKLVAAADGMPVVGPNCYGLINAMDGALLWPDQHGLLRETGGVAIVTQSSNIAINLSMQARGLPIAYLITAGNQAQTGISTLAGGVLEDPRVTALGLHIEGFDDLRKLERLALRARALGKPIVALKAGRSEGGRRATVSHTASLSGDDAVSAAVLGRLGIGRARSLPEFLETLKLLHVHGPLPGPDLASMSCSGGEAALMADAAEGRDVRFRPLGAAEAARLKAVLGGMASVANPLDYHTFVWGDAARMEAAFATMMQCGFALTMLTLDFPRGDRCDGADWDAAATAMKRAAAATGARAAVVSTLAETMPEPVARDLLGHGIAPLSGVEEALAAASIAAGIGGVWAKPPATPLLDPCNVPASRRTRMLREDRAKQVLAGHGLRIPEGRAASNPAEAGAAAVALGFPVVVKGLGAAHKTEAGLVRLGVRSRAEAEAAAGAMAGRAEGYLVEKMVPPAVAELIVGVTRDPVAGPVMTLGAGGTLVDLLRDTAVLLLPVTREDVLERLQGLLVWKLLSGYRGRVRGDVDAAVAAIVAIGRYAVAAAGRIEELEVNPLLVLPEGEGAVAADSLIREAEDDA